MTEPRVRILKARWPTFWYSDRIGEIFQTSGRVDETNSGEDEPTAGDYIVTSENSGLDGEARIEPDDCEIVKEVTK